MTKLVTYNTAMEAASKSLRSLDMLQLRWKVPEKMKHVQPELEFKLVPKWLWTYEKLISDLICFPLKGGSLLGIGWVLLGSCGVLLGVLPGVCWRRSMGKNHAGDSGAKTALVTPALQTLVPPKDKALKALKGLRSDKAFKGLIRPFKDFDRAFGPSRHL